LDRRSIPTRRRVPRGPRQARCGVHEPARQVICMRLGECRAFSQMPRACRGDLTAWLAFLYTVPTERFDQVMALRPLLPAIPRPYDCGGLCSGSLPTFRGRLSLQQTDCIGRQPVGPKAERREFITLLGGAAAWPLAACAQQSEMRRLKTLNGLTPLESARRDVRGASRGPLALRTGPADDFRVAPCATRARL
jgi:hypothetical protein